MEAKDVRTLMEAYASVYEGYGKKKKGDCVSKSEKGDHNCAKKVCHEQYGEGETIFGQHAVPDENGFVSHYDVQFEHGIVENVSVEDLEILISESHPEHVEHEGETISEMGGMLKKVAKIGAAAAGAAAAGKALEKATSSKKPTRDEKDAADAKKHLDHYRKSGKMMRSEELSIDEGIMDALKRVGKAVLGPADQSPEAEAARTGKRRGPGTAGAPKKQQPAAGAPKKQQPASMKEDADVFDIVKGHLMDEGLSEKEALEKMLTLTDEERQSIVEQQAPIHPAEAAFNKSTPEERAANTKKYGTPYRPIDTSRRSGDPTAPAWMRGGFKSRDEYNKLDQATKDLLN